MSSGVTFAGAASRIGACILVSAVLVAACFIGDPLVFPFRSVYAGFLLTLGAGVFAVALFRGRRWMAAALAVVLSVGVWQWAAPRIDEAAVWADMPDGLAVGRHFIVGYTELRHVRNLSRAGLIGGIFLTRRNVAGRALDEVASDVASLQAERQRAGLPPLIVAGDQEGGPVTHLSPPLSPVAALSREATLPGAERGAAAWRLGLDAGRDLAALGVTMDLAPVVDLKPETTAGTLDLHTQIATRAISDDPDIVGEMASNFAGGLLAAGITPTAKHFPGLARVATDTHLFGASTERSRAAMEQTDWRPFRATLALPGAAVMLSHVAVQAIDPDVPASRSHRVVEGLLRGEWGFDGLAVTDDLTMGAVMHDGLCRAVDGALNAGVDLLLVSWDTDQIYPALRCAARAFAAGRLDPVLMERSAARLDRPRRGSTAGAGNLP